MEEEFEKFPLIQFEQFCKEKGIKVTGSRTPEEQLMLETTFMYEIRKGMYELGSFQNIDFKIKDTD